MYELLSLATAAIERDGPVDNDFPLVEICNEIIARRAGDRSSDAIIKRLYALGCDQEDVADLLFITEGRVSQVLTGRQISELQPRVMELHLAGMTVLEISQELECRRASVDAWIRKAGLQPNRRKRAPLTHEQQVRIMEAHAQGFGQTEIAKQIGVAPHQVVHLLRKTNEGN